MSDFLLNLARRSAGLPLGGAPTPSPPARELRAPDLETRAPDLDASEAVAEAPSSPGEPRTAPPALAPTIGEAFTPPALPRSTATAESVTLPLTTPAGSPAGTRTAPRIIDAATMREPAPLVPATLPSPRPALSPPPVEEPVRRATPRLITEPSIASGVVALEPARSSDDASSVASPREEPAHATVSASIVIPDQRGLAVTPIVATAASQMLASPVIRPAAADSPAPPRLAAATPVTSAPAGPPPVHIRIGRVEVRGTATPPPRPPASPPAPAALGFAEYARMRTYRSWWR